MKNLLNCHCIGLHSFPVSLYENGFYRRVFYADKNHELYRPVEIAIHPHHVDIKITVLEGILYNPIYEISKDGQLFKKFEWDSHIKSGNGGFKFLGNEKLSCVNYKKLKEGESIIMPACQMHTVQVGKNEICSWLIEETKPTCDYFPINYSFKDLEKWNTDNLYLEVNDEIKNKYISKYKIK